MEGMNTYKENAAENNENAPVTKEQVLDVYAKTLDGKEDGPARDLLVKWIEQNYAQIETIEDRMEQAEALIAFEVDKAELYFETGFPEVALEELEGDGMQEGLLEMAQHRGQDELEERIMLLIEKINEHMNARQELVADSSIDIPKAQADADKIDELSAEIKEMLKK